MILTALTIAAILAALVIAAAILNALNELVEELRITNRFTLTTLTGRQEGALALSTEDALIAELDRRLTIRRETEENA